MTLSTRDKWSNLDWLKIVIYSFLLKPTTPNITINSHIHNIAYHPHSIVHIIPPSYLPSVYIHLFSSVQNMSAFSHFVHRFSSWNKVDTIQYKILITYVQIKSAHIKKRRGKPSWQYLRHVWTATIFSSVVKPVVRYCKSVLLIIPYFAWVWARSWVEIELLGSQVAWGNTLLQFDQCGTQTATGAHNNTVELSPAS